MTTKIETFEQSEVARPTVEQDDAERTRAIELATELGLTNQVALHSPKTDDKTQIIAAFKWRLMTMSERLVYGILCPDHTPLDRFEGEPIPVRVLEVIREAKPHFERGFEIWHRSEVTKDPVLVGCKPGGAETWREPIRYILARWGDELEDFGILAQKALEVWKSKQRSRFAKVMAEAKRAATDIDNCDATRFLSEAENAIGMGRGDIYFNTLDGMSRV
jgi:hypothetical protein